MMKRDLHGRGIYREERRGHEEEMLKSTFWFQFLRTVFSFLF